VTRGPALPSEAAMAVVVLGVGAPPGIATAVDSLLAQNVPLEIVVVNSGGGDLAARLGERRDAVVMIEAAERRLPGAARNLGIAHSRAPIIAFLASDCRAAAGWARERLARHRSGAMAVASALVPAVPSPDRPANLFAWCAHLALFVRRMPEIPPGETVLYGVSYHRSLFETYGLFREDLRTAEDTEFKARLPLHALPVWVPTVLTEHQSPNNFVALVWDQFIRGRRAARSLRTLSGLVPWRVASTLVSRIFLPIQLCRQYVTGPHGPVVRRACLLLPVTATAYSLGALSAYIDWPSEQR
jgi:glycosyltransferase involved in cell wall biosynthesis